MKTKHIIITSLMLFVSSFSIAQSVEGFWKVDQVMVGNMNATPVAKWFKYSKDNTYQAGNGWSQNDIGTWTYDKKTAEFLPISSKSKPDEFGAFKTSFKNGKMYWEREEEGLKVVVTLSLTAEMPMSPKDSIAGNWVFVEVTKDEKDITASYNVDNQEEIFIRWTGTYEKINPDGTKSNGFWHMDPHASEFHMIDWNREVSSVAFNVSFDRDLVKMIPRKDKSMVYTYQRK